MNITDNSITNFVIFFISLGFCALFSFLETSITALRLFKLKELAAKSTKYQELFRSLEQSPNRLLNTILVANTLANTTAATAGTFIVESFFSSWPNSVSFTLSILIITSALLIFGEIIPKNIAKARGEKLFTSTLWITNIFFYALYPFVTFLVQLSNRIIRILLGPNPSSDNSIVSEKEIRFLIDYINEKGLMEPQKTHMLRSIFELGTTTAKSIMVPLTSVITINSNKSIEQAYEKFSTHQFSRLPIYEEKPNNIIGMLHFKDLVPLVASNKQRPLKEIMRPILFIPESTKINSLLKEFKNKQMHLGMVIDEYGSIIGLVTLEDVLEEIVGDIHDEYEMVKPKIIPLKPNGWLIDASVDLTELNELLSIVLESETALTLGGFITEKMQHLPKKGERLVYKNFTFQIQQADSKKIFQVLVFEN